MIMLQVMRKWKFLRLKSLAKRCGYKSSKDKRFKKALSNLIEKGKVKVERSGYRSDSNQHPKLVVYIEGPEKRWEKR